MVKYLVIHESNSLQEVEVFDTLEIANKEAQSQWDLLIESEQKKHDVYVLDVTEDDLYQDAFGEDGEINWTMWASGGHEDGIFFDTRTK